MFLSFLYHFKTDRTWFKRTFDLHYEKIRNYLYYRLGDMESAEDITQEVFVKLWENRKKIIEGKELGFLFQVASNLFKNHYKREKYHLEFVSNTKLKDDVETPEFVLEMKEFDERLQQAIADLPEKCRSIFLLNRIDKMTYAEIAECNQVSVKAIEKQMSKALSLLKSSLGMKL